MAGKCRLFFTAVVVVLAGCTTVDLQPIPGSITYNGQPRTKLTKSPVGSTFPHRFRDPYGNSYVETYRIEPDRSLSIIDRRRTDLFIGLGDGMDR